MAAVSISNQNNRGRVSLKRRMLVSAPNPPWELFPLNGKVLPPFSRVGYPGRTARRLEPRNDHSSEPEAVMHNLGKTAGAWQN